MQDIALRSMGTAVPEYTWQHMVRKANVLLYHARMCCHHRFSKENPADIEPYEMTYFLWTLATRCKKATVFPLPLLCFFFLFKCSW